MKIYTAALTLLVFTFSACKKNQTVCLASQPAAESVALAEFCTANGINYTVDANGIYYEILQQGIGSFPANDSLITVAYTSSDLNGRSATSSSRAVAPRPAPRRCISGVL